MIKEPKKIEVYAHWQGMIEPSLMGILLVNQVRGKEVFAFNYASSWLQSSGLQELDPNLGLFIGPQYARDGDANFGIFLDSAPDRWGRILMQRREAQRAKIEDRRTKALFESDYLLGVYDEHRMGALRFKLPGGKTFLDDQHDLAAPPWTQLRDLEYASLQLERANAETDSDYLKWLNMLIAPGGSLGGARPKASVIDTQGHPWIAKFPSRRDEINIAKWEYLLYSLAKKSGIITANAELRQFSGEYHTFLTQRFDRIAGARLHFASAMTMLGKRDGDGADTGVSYLDLADFIISKGAKVDEDLEQLWRRIVFNVCVSNTDDHLRNHGFILTSNGWKLSPAYDLNPVATAGGLALNISMDDNAQDLQLVLSVASYFRLSQLRALEIMSGIVKSLKNWPELAKQLGLTAREINLMRPAFAVIDSFFS